MDPAHHGPHHRRPRRRPAAWAPHGSGSSRSTICRRRSAGASTSRSYPYVVSFRAAAERIGAPAADPRRSRARGCGLAATGRVPIAGSPGADVVHGTNYVVPPSRLPDGRVGVRLLVPAPTRAEHRPRSTAPASGAAPRRGARRVRARQSRRRRPRRPASCSATDRVEVVHLGPLPRARRRHADRSPAVGIDGRPFVLAIGTFERRKNLPTLVAAFGHLADSLGDSRARARRRARRRQRPRSTPPIDALAGRRPVARDLPRTGRRRRQGLAAASTPSVLAYPSLDEGFGFPILEAQTAGDAGRRQPRRVDPRGRRRRRRCSSTATIRPPRRRHRTRGRRAGSDGSRLVEAGLRNVSRFSWDRHRVRHGGAVPACHRRSIVNGSDVTVEPRSRCSPAVSARHVFLRGLVRVVDAERRHRDRQHRRRHRAARPDDLARPRHDHVHARRGDRSRARLGARRRDVAGDGGARAATPASARRARAPAPTWFNLGDRDLATHLYRTARLGEGATLTEVTAEIARAWGLGVPLLPMTDDRLRTMVDRRRRTARSAFQDYFVRLRHDVAGRGRPVRPRRRDARSAPARAPRSRRPTSS